MILTRSGRETRYVLFLSILMKARYDVISRDLQPDCAASDNIEKGPCCRMVDPFTEIPGLPQSGGDSEKNYKTIQKTWLVTTDKVTSITKVMRTKQ